MRDGRRRRGAAAIVLAGGSGSRVGSGRNKVYLPLAGRTVVSWSLNTFAAMPAIGPVVLVVRHQDRDLADWVLDREVQEPGIEVVTGGASRQASELAGLRHLAGRIGSGEVDTVLIHDGARPLVGPDLTAEVLAAARDCGGAVPGLPRDDVARASDGDVGERVPHLVAVQTPQAFRAVPLLAAYEEADRRGFSGTDTASCVQEFAPEVTVRVVPGDEWNLKITYAQDVLLAERVLARAGRPRS